MTESRYTDPLELEGRAVQGSEVTKLRPVGVPRPVGTVDPFSASWEIAARVVQRTLEREGELTVQLYLTGYGVPDWAKLVYYPPKGLLGIGDPADPGRPAEVEIRFAYKSGVGDRVTTATGVVTRMTMAIAESMVIKSPPDGGFFDIPGGLFLPRPQASRKQQNIFETSENEAHHIVCEADDEDFAPIEIRSHISEGAARGDHSLPFVLTYLTKGQVRTARYDLDLHVQQFWETSLFQVLAAIGSVIVVGASIIAALK